MVTGIIYTFSKKDSEDVTADLQSRGIKAGCYHADLSARERSRVHKAWIENSIHVRDFTVVLNSLLLCHGEMWRRQWLVGLTPDW